MCGNGGSLNFELNDTLEAIKSEMNMDNLPDLSKLNLENDGDDEKDIDAFLEDEDEDEDDDVDLAQDKMMKHKLGQNEECGVDENGVIDIVM